jgi:prepilin-type N-terminal cleavage/methylation domain-containing protein
MNTTTVIRKRSRKQRLGRLGFSLVEVLVGSGILAIGVLAGVRLYTKGAERSAFSRSRTAALEMATQRLEWLGTKDFDDLPACSGATSCRSGGGFGSPLAAAGTFQCTQYSDGMELPDPDTVTDGSFRIDTVVSNHPDTARQANTRLVTVSVCWQDQSGRVQQAQVRRVVIPWNEES